MQFIPSMISVIIFYFNSAPVVRLMTGADPMSPERISARRAAVVDFISAALFSEREPLGARRTRVSSRNKIGILIGVIFLISLTYYLISTPRSKDLVLVGTVDGNQVIVSPQIQGRLAQLLVDEGTHVKQGDLIAAARRL